MKSNKLIMLLAGVMAGVGVTTAALAHDDDDDHHGTSAPPVYATSSGHSDLQSGGYPNFAGYKSYWTQHAQEHELLRRAEREADQLATQGLISQQEHALLDAQWQADHAAYDGRQLPNNFNYTFQSSPYVDPAVPGVLQRLAGTWGMGAAQTYGGGAVPQAGTNGGVVHAVTDAMSGNASGHLHQAPGYQSPAPGGGLGSYTRYWDQHQQDHQVLRRSEREAHELLEQGVITPQEQALLDAQWQADHAAYDGRELPTTFGYRFQTPYVTPGVQGVLAKLRSHWGM